MSKYQDIKDFEIHTFNARSGVPFVIDKIAYEKDAQTFHENLIGKIKIFAEHFDRDVLKQVLKGNLFYERSLVLFFFGRALKVPFIKIKTKFNLKPFADVVKNNNIKNYEDLVEYNKKQKRSK